MSTFWLVVIVLVIAIAVLWFVSSIRKKSKTVRSFSALDEAAAWFQSQGIDPKSVVFGYYEDQKLVRIPGATVLVGYGKASGEDTGFAIEVIPGSGVVASELIKPSGIASHHRQAAMQAKMSGECLLDVLGAMAMAHRSQYPQ